MVQVAYHDGWSVLAEHLCRGGYLPSDTSIEKLRSLMSQVNVARFVIKQVAPSRPGRRNDFTLNPMKLE
jgi:hypothetical protein